jgi:WD40 repeat protein
MKDPKAFDKTGSMRPAPSEGQALNVSRDIIRDTLADLIPAGRITHRIGTHLHQYHGVAISPDGSKMLTANRDRTARLWDMATGQCLMVFEGHTGELRRAAFTNDGTRAVTTADDGTLRLSNLATGECDHVMEGHRDTVTPDAVSPGDRHVISGSADGTVRVWSLPGGTPEHIVELGGRAVTKICVTDDAATLVAFCSGNDIRRWSFPDMDGPFPVAEGKFPFSFQDIALTGDGKLVAAAWDGLYSFDIRTGARESFFSFEPLRPYKVTVAPDGKRFVTCCHLKAILVVDRRTGRIEKELTGHRDDVTGMALSSDGRTLCTVSLDWTCRTWDIVKGECIRTIKPARNLSNLSLSGDGTCLAAFDDGGSAKVWSLLHGSNRTVTGDAASLTFLVLPDLIATGHRDGKVCLWENRGGGEAPVKILKDHKYPVDRLVPLQSGASLASCAYDGVRLWNVQKGDCIGTCRIPGKAIALAVDENMERVAAARMFEKDILMLDLRSGERLALLKGHAWPPVRDLWVLIRDLHFLDRGRGLVSCGRDGRVILWDPVTFEALRCMEGGDLSISSMAVEDDGRHVVVGAVEGAVERWDLESGHRDLLWSGEGHPVLSVALSPDEERIFASFSDGTVRIIERQSAALICTLWNVDAGFFWFTPPDGHAPDGWVWTDRDDLLHVVAEGFEGRVLGALPLTDDRRRTYVQTRNTPAMVKARRKSLDEYARAVGIYDRALADKRQEATPRHRPMLPKGDGHA